MRSSIACIRCRRSKVKCVNNGVGTTCRSCDHSGRECTYPSPVTSTTRRRDSFPGKGSNDGVESEPRRQRPRKSTQSLATNPLNGGRESPRPLLDALDPRLLTSNVWQELFDIFQVHYSADLPFLHPPTFLKPLRQGNMQQSSSMLPTAAETNNAIRPPASPEFLLAFLALTARFHPKMVAHHSPPTATRPSNPLIASEYYASAANERLSTSWTDNRIHDIERIQATLMIGLHEWGMCRGAKAWLTIGLAIRAAQAMGLQYERDLDDEPMSRALALEPEAERMGLKPNNTQKETLSDEDAFVDQEVRRRTFWSCYIMDRYLSSGKYRPQMLHANELRIQLPASERAFLFAEKVRTLMLGEEERSNGGRAEVQHHRQASVMLGRSEHDGRNSVSSLQQDEKDEDRCRLEVGSDEGLVSRYVKILEIYGKVVQWSCAGGRRIEKLPPWDPQCEWYKLRQQCLEFKANLPRTAALTPQNIQAHISLKTSTPYTLMHTVHLLCQIMLHREYVPFLPLRCSKPEGPLDPPTFPQDRYQVPPHFWEDNARDLFKAARDIMDLVRSCQEWNALVETPIVGFAIYTVAFTGVYSISFPWMDPEGFMCTPPSSGTKPNGASLGEGQGFIAARKALEMIGQMRLRFRMADGWFLTISRMYKYFKRMRADYRKNVQAIETGSPENDSGSTLPLSLREGGTGGGLDEWKMLERTIRDFGNLEDHDTEMTDIHGLRTDGHLYDDSSAGTTVKSEERDARMAQSDPPKSEPGPWAAINAVPGAHSSRRPSVTAPTPNSSQFRSYDSYPSQYQTTQNPLQSQAHPAPPQPQPGYPQVLSSFRPAYSADTPGPPGGPPSLMSPSTTTPSQASSFERRSSTRSSWVPQNASYQMQPPLSNYSNGTQHTHSHGYHSGQVTPMQSTAMYPTPQPPLQPQQQPPLGHIQQSAVQPAWDAYQKEAWLNSLQTRMSADDLAAFVDGGDVADWQNPGWLSTIWSGAGTA